MVFKSYSYHSSSLITEDWRVELAGYGGLRDIVTNLKVFKGRNTAVSEVSQSKFDGKYDFLCLLK